MCTDTTLQWRKATTGSMWQTRNIYPRQYLRSCGFTHCNNPRSVDLRGLTSGTRYFIKVSALGADGIGTTRFIRGAPAPDYQRATADQNRHARAPRRWGGGGVI